MTLKINYLSVFFTVLFLFEFKSQAQEDFVFIPHEQFVKLTSGEQNNYIHALQNLILQFEEVKDFAPKKNASLKQSSLFSQFFAQAYASDVDSSKIRSNDTREENAKISIQLVFLDSYIQVVKNRPSATLKSTVQDSVANIYERLLHLSQKDMSIEQKANLNTNISNFKKKYQEAQSVVSDVSKMNLDFQKLKTQRSESPVIESKTSARPALQKTLIQKERPFCLYSGFVITGPKCSPLQSLPESCQIKELASTDFKCKSKSEILCNPLVFGYQKDLSPYCVRRSQTASKNCQEISNNSENIARVQAVWKNSNNKKIFDDYQNSLKELCSSENRSSDVKATCKIVVAQFNDVVKKEFPSFLAARKADEALGSNSSKSSKKN
jgi:hypothetical protein